MVHGYHKETVVEEKLNMLRMHGVQSHSADA
jgi:hypothetical protein